MRDLQIRGGGNLLGAEQSGHIAEIGYDLYCKVLDQTVRELKGEAAAEPIDVTLHLGGRACVPVEYIPDEPSRLEVYRKLGDVQRSALGVQSAGPCTRNSARRTVNFSKAIDKVAEELSDRYGPLPAPVRRLLDEAELRALAAVTRVPYVGIDGARLKLRLHGWDFQQLERKLASLDHNVRVLAEDTITLPLPAGGLQSSKLQVQGSHRPSGPNAGPETSDVSGDSRQKLHAYVKKVLQALI
jgi:transcription-repair coupling factor (superfamily II helicase)